MPRHLALVPRDRGVAVLIRHAERPPLSPGQAGDEVELTPVGRIAARELGAKLGGALLSVWTSPVRRCRETAELIVEGGGVTLAVGEDRLLGAPGAFVADGALAWRNWEELGNSGVIEHLVVSEEALPGMHPPSDAAHRLHAHLLAHLDEKPGFHIFATHDAVLAPYVSRVLRLRDVLWPGWLASVAVWREGASVWLAFEGDTEPRLCPAL